VVVGVIAALGFRAYAEDRPGDGLPVAVKEAVKATCPKKAIRVVERTDDPKYGMMVYLVSMGDPANPDNDAALTNVYVTEKGTVIWVLNWVEYDEVPHAVMDTMEKMGGDGEIMRTYRTEVYTDNKLVKYDNRKIRYIASLAINGGGQRDVEVGEDGTMIERVTFVKLNDVPKAVIDTMMKAANGGRIENVKRIEKFADEKSGKLDTPKVEYNGWLRKEGHSSMVLVSEDGKVIAHGAWYEEAGEE